MATKETLHLLLSLKIDGEDKLKDMGADADKAAQRLEDLTNKVDITTRTMAVQRRELESLQNQYRNTAGRATELADSLEKTTAAEGKNSAAAQKLQAELDKTATAAQKLAIAIDKKEISLQRGANALTKIANEAKQTGTALQSEAQQAQRAASVHLELGRSSESAGAGFAGLATRLGGLAAGFMGLSAIAGQAAQGFTLTAELDQSRRMLGTLFQDVEKGNKVYQEAIAWGQKYGYTQQEIASATASAAGIIRTSTAGTEKSLEVIARLGTLNPAEGIEGAVVAIKELASGDIVSLAERFNVSKDAARAMKDEIAAGADPIMVLDKALADMGVTAEVLSNRMEGPNGALLRNKQAMESLTLSLGSLLEAFGATYILEAFAAGLDTIAAGITNIAGGVASFFNQDAMFTASLTEGTARMMERGAAFSEYAAKMQELGLSNQALTQSEYEAAQAMIAKGTAANDAIAAAQTLSDTQAELATSLIQIGVSSGMSEEAQAALIERTMALASASPEAAASIAELVAELDGGRGSIEDFTTGLDEQTLALEAVAINQEFAASTTFGYADAQAAAAAEIDNTTGAIYDVTDATYEQELASANAAIQAEQQARFQEDLAWATDMSGDSAFGAAAAAAYLVNAYGLEIDQVNALIKAHNQLNEARAGRKGSAVGRAAAGAANRISEAPGGAAGFHDRSVERQARERSGRGGGGGRGRSGGGKGRKPKESEEVKQARKDAEAIDKVEEKLDDIVEKHLDKRAELEQDHADKVKAITDKYVADKLAAEKELQDKQQASRADFYTYIAGLDKAQRDEAMARYEEAWAISNQLAAEGKAAEAEAYRQAAEEAIQADLEREAKIAEIRAQLADETAELTAQERADLEERIRLLEYADKLADDSEAKKLEDLKNANDSIAQERDEALAEEEARFSEAGAKLKEDFDAAVANVSDGLGKMSEAARIEAEAIIAAAQAAAAAVNAIPMPSAGGEPVPVEARALGGPIRRGFPYLVGENGPELIVPSAAGTVIPAGQTAALRSGAGMSSPLASVPTPTRTAGGSVTTNTSSSAVTIMPGAVVINAGNRSPAEIAALVDERLQRFARQTGGSAANRRKMGS